MFSLACKFAEFQLKDYAPLSFSSRGAVLCIHNSTTCQTGHSVWKSPESANSFCLLLHGIKPALNVGIKATKCFVHVFLRGCGLDLAVVRHSDWLLGTA